jgi:hypothetical protein
MSLSQNPNPNSNRTPQEQELREQVRTLDEQALSLKNILSLRTQIKKAAKEENFYNKLSAKLSSQETANARNYAAVSTQIASLEKQIETQKNRNNAAGNRAARQLEASLKRHQAMQKDLFKTEGGFIEAQSQAAAKRKGQLEAERNLVKDINKQRGLGGKIMDLFRSKEERQRQIDIARLRAGGGANKPPGGSKEDQCGCAEDGKGGGKEGSAKRTAAAFTLAFEKVKQVLTQWTAMASKAITAPFADAAQLLTGEDYGMGSGKLKTTGAGSILGGIQEFASSIPVIGGLLGGLVGMVKTIVEGILGLEQGIFRFARAMNISYGQANRMKASFDGIAASSGHIALNSARMMQSQVEIGNYLGTNKQLSADILKNDVLLRDVIGTELDIRQSIAQTAKIAGKDAVKLTQSIIGSTIQFNKLVGTGFNFNMVMREASKLSGVIGLAFAKYPEKMVKTIMTAKTLGFELQQLDGIASSLLDFETSISKEMEAQILTGKEMDLTRAREASNANDYNTLAQEITKNIGDANYFLGLKRIQQEAIAESVGQTANGLADILKKQELYMKLGATDLKTFNEKIALLEKQGKTQEQISAMIGKDAYNSYTQVSTAERITEILEKMKRTFVELIKSSGIFDFITKPENITNFVRKMADILAGAISMTGKVIASLMEGVAYIVSWFSDEKAYEIRGLAAGIRYGTGTFAESMRVATGTMGGTPAPSVGATVQNGTRQQTQANNAQSWGPMAPSNQGIGPNTPVQFVSVLQVDKDVLAKASVQATPQQFAAKIR